MIDCLDRLYVTTNLSGLACMSALSFNLLAMDMEQSVAMNRERAGSYDITMDMGVYI
jgi:hypothetical protein